MTCVWATVASARHTRDREKVQILSARIKERFRASESWFEDGEDHRSCGAGDRSDEFKVLGHEGSSEKNRESYGEDGSSGERECVCESERVRVFLFFIYIWVGYG